MAGVGEQEARTVQGSQTSSGRLCEAAIRAFDRLCEVERRRTEGLTEPTPRQRARRALLETRARADEWLVPEALAATVAELVAAADRIDDPAIAQVWTDHLPVAVLSCLERRGLARRLVERDPLVVGA
jgi:hypothetical protein